MIRDDVIASIRQHAEAIRAQGATAVWLFGSVARGEARPDSDVDVLVDLRPDASLVDIIGIKHIVEDAVGRRVDIGERTCLKGEAARNALREAIRIL